DHLRVEHQAEEAALLVGRDREGRALGAGDDGEALGQLLDAIAVAHPYLVALARLPQAIEEHALAGHLDEGAAELAAVRARHPAAELERHRLLAVADGEHRHARLEEMGRRARAVRPGHRGRPAREDDAPGL